MKAKLIAGLTTLSLLAFPMTSLAAQVTPAPTQTTVCPVAGCQISGNHAHGAGCVNHANHANGAHYQGDGHAYHSSGRHH